MIINTVPRKLLGTVVCIATVWTAFLPGRVFGSSAHVNLQTKLKEIKATLGLSEGFQDHTAPDPNYKTALNFMGAWMIGDQLGESTIGKGVQVTNNLHVKHIQTLLPFLKARNSQLDLNDQSVILENALHIHEILKKLSSSDTSASIKTEIIPQLNDRIFETAAISEVLIPVVWAGVTPGGTLISISRTQIKIFDTVYDYNKNKSDSGNKYPSVKNPYRMLRIKDFDGLKKYKKVILALLVMMDDEKLKFFDKQNTTYDKLIYALGSSFGIVNDQGYKYFSYIFLPIFNYELNFESNSDEIKMPLLRSEIGPVADIIAYLSSTFTSAELSNFMMWRLSLSHQIFKQFLFRYGSDTDIHLEARDQNVVVEIVKRCANRLLRDTIVMAVSKKLLPEQVGGNEDDLWRLLETFDMSDTRTDSKLFDNLTVQFKKVDFVMKEMQKIYSKSILPRSETNRVEAFDSAMDVRNLVFTRLKELSVVELKSIVEAFDNVVLNHHGSSFTDEQINGINSFVNAIKNDKRQEIINALKGLNKELETTNSDKKSVYIKEINGIVEDLKKKSFSEKDRIMIFTRISNLRYEMIRVENFYEFLSYSSGVGPTSLNSILGLIGETIIETDRDILIDSLGDNFKDFNNEILFNLIKTIKEEMRAKKTEINGQLEDIRKGRKTNEVQNTKSHRNAKEIEMIAKIVELHKDAMEWIKSKGNDVYKLSKISRSLGQREMSLRQITHFGIAAIIDIPIDMNKYLGISTGSPDLTDCMSRSKRVITNIDEFIDAFAPFVPRMKWFRLSYGIENPHCAPFLRRNAELMLRNMRMSGLDHESLKKWTPKNQKQYKVFMKTASSIFGAISSLPNTEKTLEDYVIILRLQRTVWRVAQALDSFFAKSEPKRHLDLLQYSLTYPQCHNLVKGKMTYSNYFLADSGAYGTILNTETMAELMNLCKSLIEEENSAKPVLNYEKYMAVIPPWLDPLAFDRINPGDREIYYKMAQNPLISRIVRENHPIYNLGGESVSENAARSACLGQIGSQILYYQFFDALKHIFTSNLAISQPVNTFNFIPLAYIPLKGFGKDGGSILAAIPRRMSIKTTLTPINEELIKMAQKSYLKTSITEMVTSHILGLDVLLNHLGRGSVKFWSTGSIIEEKQKEDSSFFGFDIVEEIKLYAEDFRVFLDLINGDNNQNGNSGNSFIRQEKKQDERFNIKTFRRNVAGTADFFLNCSSHLLRKLDLAPGYEDLILALLMKAFKAADDDLIKTLKEMESVGEVEFKAENEEEIDSEKEEHKKNEKYLKGSKTSPDEFLKSLINWSVLAIRFNARVKSLKPHLENHNPSLPSQLYTAMLKYSSLNSGNNRQNAPLDHILTAHVDYALFMICAMNLGDVNLRQTVYDNLSGLTPATDENERVKLPKDGSVLTSAMLMHRVMALNNHETDKDGPLTEDFISHQFAVDRVMDAINSLDEHNESFLVVAANYMSALLDKDPKFILENYSQVHNLKKGILTYGHFSINLIQGTVLENGQKARNPNDILRYPLFRQFFSSGAEQLAATLGRDTADCPIRYEVHNFLKPGTRYSICEYREKKHITIYRHIPKFQRPCLLVIQQRVIDALQYAFSIYPNAGVDIYHCKRGNNANFVWIARNAVEPMYTSHGRLWFIHQELSKHYFSSMTKIDDAKKSLMEMFALQKSAEFDFNVKTKLQDLEMSLFDVNRLMAPTIFFPRIEINKLSDESVFPLTAETKMMIVPEPMIRFSGGNHFGTYMHSNNLIFMFQQFRFRDRPELALTFIEGKDGNLEMKGREDLKICEDQIFENNFWPALMMKKIDETGNEIRFAYVPITNLESGGASTSISNGLTETLSKKDIDEKASVAYDPESENKFSLSGSSQMIFMEAMAVQRGAVKMVNSKGEQLYEYKLTPTSRLQRILMAYYNLKLRNYDETLYLLDPRNDFDHNTELNDNEILILNWMIQHVAGQDPEALALRLMAKIHLILDKELFPVEDQKRIKMTGISNNDELLKMVFDSNDSIINAYVGKEEVDFSSRDFLGVDAKDDPVNNLGAYFNYIHVLPKRFHVDQVFKEAMASLKVKKFMYSEYNNGILIPPRQTQIYGDLKFEYQCEENDSFSFDYDGKIILSKFFLESPDQATQNKLDEAIKNRYSTNFMEKNCELARIMCRKIISVYGHAANKRKRFSELGLDELQELAVLYLQFKGTYVNSVDRMLNRLIYPGVESNTDFTEIRRLIDLNKFNEELEVIRDEDGNEIPTPKPKLRDFTEAVTSTGRLRKIYNHPDLKVFAKTNNNNGMRDEEEENNSIQKFLLEFLEEMKPSFVKTDVRVFMNFLYSAPKVSNDINSIKFTADDLQFISAKDRKVFSDVIERINSVFKKHEGDFEDDETFKLIGLRVGSETQKSLQAAVYDYMKDYKMKIPKEFDRFLGSDPFEDLQTFINERTAELERNLKTLERNYDNFFKEMKHHGVYKSVSVLANLKRMFDSNRKPSLPELRDCLMQMKLSCLKNRLPEFSKKEIINVLQVLKEYYIQKILLNNLASVKRKIVDFNDLAKKAADAESLLPNADVRKTEQLKVEIFGHKDTASLVVDDILVDMQKLMLFEVRLQDPVTLNFEFMSAKFHLTNIQVQDIASLATRRWEDTIKDEIIPEIKAYEHEVSEKNLDISDQMQKDNPSQYKTNIKILEDIGKEYLAKLPKNLVAIFSKYLKLKQRFKDRKDIDPKELWTYMPRDERLIKSYSKEVQNFNNYYGHRPMLQAIGTSGLGTLKPYDPEKDSYISRVIQRKMAAGKTTVLGTAATVKKADGKTLSVLVILSSLYQSSAPDMQKRTSEFFKTRGFAFSMPKPRLTIPAVGDTDHPGRNFLTWTLKNLINTINSNGYLVVTPETLQAFLNSYVEYLDAFINTPVGKVNPELSHCLHLFATIYEIFRQRGSIILDEIDSSMRPQKELNFPTTKRENILLSGVELISDLLLHSAVDEDIKAAGLNLLANQQAALNDDQYNDVRKLWRDYVKEQLESEEVNIWNTVFLTADSDEAEPLFESEDLVKFFFDPSALDSNDNPVARQREINFMVRIKEKDEKIFHAMMVIKMQLKTWLRNCFKGAVNEHYGPAINQPGQKPIHYAIPYLAAKTPAEGSIFADRWETVNKTLMMYLVKDLSLDELSKILSDLISISQKDVQSLNLKEEFAAACPGRELLSIRFNPQNKIVDKDESIMKCMKGRSIHSLRLIFYWVMKVIFEKEEFFAEQITSNAINLTSMFPSVQGYSGTIDNVNILPHQVMIEAEKDHKENEKANGAITMKLLQQKNCVTTVQSIETITKIDKLLDEMCKGFNDLSIFSAFIDVGALLKDYNNSDVAVALAKKFKRKTILYYDELSNKLQYLEYDPTNDSKLRATLEGSETKYLDSATNSFVKDRFTYYDQRHITGSDILQPPTAKAFLTIGPKVLLRDILQGVMRMRQFQSGQSIHFITTSSVETLLSKYCEGVLPEGNLPRVNQKHLIALGALNEDEKQLNENVRLYRVKIDAEIRAFVIDKLTEALAERDPYVDRCNAARLRPYAIPHEIKLTYNHEELFKKTRPLFIRNVQEDPISWATINEKVPASEVVKQYMEKRVNLVPEYWKTLDGSGWDKVVENLKIITKPKDESADSRSVLQYLSDDLETTQIPKEFNAPKGELTEFGGELEMQLQLELQQELKVELEQCIQTIQGLQVLPEPTLSISKPPEQEHSFDGTMSYPLSVTSPYDLLSKIPQLLTPWKLYESYGTNVEFDRFFETDILCPGLSNGRNGRRTDRYCQENDGFVGITQGLAKVSTSPYLDFVTLMSREATHLLFWRGKDSIKNKFKYGIFLLTGSEAISLHQSWVYKSCISIGTDTFWLTDLYGFEVHGSPFTETDISSKKFSLLEKEYNEHFARLHFRALILNGSYNVIMASKEMYHRLRIWIGDNELLKNHPEKEFGTVGISPETASKRAKLFLSRMSWTSKLRDEIVPQDPFIRLLMRVSASIPAHFDETDKKYGKEHVSHNHSELNNWRYNDNVLIHHESEDAKPWKSASNINTSKGLNPISITVIALVIVAILAAGVFIWGQYNGIVWSEVFTPKEDEIEEDQIDGIIEEITETESVGVSN